MSFCPYCKEIVGSNVTECPSCGMSWDSAQPPGEQPTQGRTLPRVTAEEPLPPPPEQPAQQPQYQPPPQQPAYQPQYQQPPPQPAYQPPPQPAYQPPLQQSTYQPQPQYSAQPQYQQPYAAPAYAAPRRKVGGGGLAMAIVGGIMAMAGSFFLWYSSSNWGTNFMGVQDISNNVMLYAWLIPLFGLLAMIFGIVAFAAQKKSLGSATSVFGLLAFLIAVVLPIHMALDFEMDILDIFFRSGTGFIFIYLGGFIAIFGGILAMAGGSNLSKNLVPVRYPPQQYYR